MVGSLEEAQIAYNKVTFNRRPRGYKKIGEGCTRTAILAPSGVVYKVGDERANNREAQAFRRYRRWKSLASKNVHIPQLTQYRIENRFNWGRTVNAMPYIDSVQKMECASEYWPFNQSCDCQPETRPSKICYTDLMEWLGDRGMDDMWSGNIRYSSDGKFYVIDLGHNNR